jgi:hypothetical protein
MGHTNSTGGWTGALHVVGPLESVGNDPLPQSSMGAVEAFVTDAGEIALRGPRALNVLCRHEAGELARALLECAESTTAPCTHG